VSTRPRRGVTQGVLAAIAAWAIGCGEPQGSSDAAPPRSDAPPATGELGADCVRHGDCIDGYCVEAIGGVGGVCTRICNDDCPPDWSCREVRDPAVRLCIPNAPQLCLACATDLECGGDGACLTLDGTGSCATRCTAECPTGYVCAADATGARDGTYCQPVTGSCACTSGMAGATRACTNPNAIGTCFGTQTCDPATGWSDCTAATATEEVCDGQDNDCDFLIDEDVGGGEPCSITVAGIGTCIGGRTCGGAAGFVCEGQVPTAELCNYADDDCDGSTDEGFAGLGTLCSPGVGACQRFGSIRCTADGMGVECSVVAGAPGTELCNQIDDDCDGKVDEAFPELGTGCSAGLGVCTRYGTTVCSSGGTMTACSATAAMPTDPETCNYLDDDCDGVVDNGFRNPLTGAYDMTAHCGACGNNCTAVYTGANSSGVCSTAGSSPQCVMVCDPGTADLNSSTVDGCEFVLDPTSVYVSVADPGAADDSTCGLGPIGTGTGNHPCRTIAYGLARATSLSRPNVRIADGTYAEAVTLVSGKHLFGGYRAQTWERHLATTSTVIQGITSTGNHDRTVTAINVTSATFEGFVVRGPFNTKVGGNSYAIYISGADATLAIRDNQIFAGRGGPGADGPPGTNGGSGPNGTGSVNGSYDGFIASGSGSCATSNNRQFSNGAVFSCGSDNVGGGNGGGNRCPPAGDFTQYSGINGFAGQPGAGTGGGAAGAGAQAGWDGQLEIQGLSSRCYLPPQPMFGLDGSSGQPAGHGSPGAGCATSAGSVTAGHWVNGSASPGIAGANGGGGGGGGAGGGGLCSGCGGSGKDRLGAHGGGGGAGGCGGTGGGPGGSGGGVFGIFVVGGSAPTIASNTIQRGAGGSAGDGGIGGAGGLGGSGAAGGDTSLLCAGKAGRGGDGGNGGHGSGGGGGCGGSSHGIFTSGVGTPNYCSSNMVTAGSPGAGGLGGFSGGNSGGNGAGGTLGACTSI
jgi:hypothetical protein